MRRGGVDKLSDKVADKGKIESIQKIVSDPKAIESLMSQVTPDQISAALSFFNNLDPNSKKSIGNLISNLGANQPKQK